MADTGNAAPGFLATEAAQLPVPSESAVRLFRDELPRLLKTVEDKLAIDERHECGAIPCAQLDFVTHSNRAFGRTLLGIHETGLMELLPGEFESHAAALLSRGADSGFFRTMLRTWVGTVHATITDPEAEELARPLEWLGQHLAELLDGAQADSPSLTIEQAEFLQLLLDHRRRDAAEHALNSSKRNSVEAVIAELMLPVLSHIGVLWQASELTVAQEHAATEMCRYVVFRLYDSQPASKRLPHNAMVVCAPGEEHELGAEMMAGFLEHSGWDVLFVGRSTPANDILRTAQSLGPDVVMLSVTMVANLPAAISLARELKKLLLGVKLVVGGRAAVAGRRVLESEVDTVADGIKEGYEAASGLVES